MNQLSKIVTKSKLMKKICIIGGAGFIGHNLALRLADLSYEISIKIIW